MASDVLRFEVRSEGFYHFIAAFRGAEKVGTIELHGPVVKEILSYGGRGERIGTRLYEFAAQYVLQEFDQLLESDTDRSKQADSFWQKQARLGRAELIEDETSEGSFYRVLYPDDGKYNFHGLRGR